MVILFMVHKFKTSNEEERAISPETKIVKHLYSVIGNQRNGKFYQQDMNSELLRHIRKTTKNHLL